MLLSVALQAGAQDYKQSITYPRQPSFELSGGMKAVKRSTDILALALPAAALVGTLCMRDWKGLLQGVETAAVAAAITYALKYTVKERRPDGSDWHSFPSGHTAVSFATATYLTRRYGWKAWGRCFSRQHWVWACVVGAAVGAGSALIFTTPFARKHNLQLAPVADGNSVGVYASLTF